jgi:hypothetical protein
MEKTEKTEKMEGRRGPEREADPPFMQATRRRMEAAYAGLLIISA